jgi:hypothetical protein
MERRLPGSNAGETIARGKPTVLRGQAALGVFSVDEPMQELGVLRDAPVVRLASGDVGIQVVERADVHRLDGGDLPEALDLPASESNLRAEADHGRST